MKKKKKKKKSQDQSHTGPCLSPPPLSSSGGILPPHQEREYLRRLAVLEQLPAAKSDTAIGRRLAKKKQEIENQMKFDRLARGRGWKPCPGCKSMTEKTEGCDHMA